MKFSDYQLQSSLSQALQHLNFEETTPIQAQAFPPIFAGQDVAGLAQTGTGKTGAFLIPLIDRVLRSKEAKPEGQPEEGESEAAAPVYPPFERWQPRNFVLVLVPTRELAEQVLENTKSFTQFTDLQSVAVYGGTSYDKQKAAFERGVDFVIATPGRLIDLYKEHVIDLKQVRAVVFDEADRMFDMGFKDDMKFILRRIPEDRQFLVFSATLNFDVLNVAYEFGADPVEINISRDKATADNVTDELFHVGHYDKPLLLLSLLKRDQPKQCIVFSNFKRNVERIAVFLNRNGIPAVGISSLLTQAQRNRVMQQFKGDSEQNILVATDVAARGLDIRGVDLVINFELPDDPENYIHRIGRTGRAGSKGRAFSLAGDRDIDALKRIEDFIQHKVEMGWVDDADLLKECEPFPSESEADPVRPKRSHDSSPRRSSGREGGRDRGPRRDRQERGDRPERRDSRDQRDQRHSKNRSHKPGGPREQDRDQQKGKRPQHAPQAARAGGGKPMNGSQTQSAPPPRRPASGDKNFSRPPRDLKKTDDGRRRYTGGRRSGAGTSSQMVPPQTIGQKVSGFFKRLVGK